MSNNIVTVHKGERMKKKKKKEKKKYSKENINTKK